MSKKSHGKRPISKKAKRSIAKPTAIPPQNHNHQALVDNVLRDLQGIEQLLQYQRTLIKQVHHSLNQLQLDTK